MLFKLHFRGEEPNVLGIEYWIKIEPENKEVILDWTILDGTHPLADKATNLDLNKTKVASQWLEVEQDEYFALEIPQLMFSKWENDFGYNF